jgi:hypothetical protein
MKKNFTDQQHWLKMVTNQNNFIFSDHCFIVSLRILKIRVRHDPDQKEILTDPQHWYSDLTVPYHTVYYGVSKCKRCKC